VITNEREYRITRAQARDLERALAEGERGPVPDDIHPTLAAAAREALRGELDELKRQLEEFDQLRNGRTRHWVVESLGKLPEVIIQARIAAGMTHKQFADRLEVKEQQVQRYESSRYHGVSLERLEQAAVAAGLQFQISCWRALPERERLSSTWSPIVGTWQPTANMLTSSLFSGGIQRGEDFVSVANDPPLLNSLAAGGNVVINFSTPGNLGGNDRPLAWGVPQTRGAMVPVRERLGMEANRQELEVAR
jgi:transcriptional regulator with XRE-family HTH domain